MHIATHQVTVPNPCHLGDWTEQPAPVPNAYLGVWKRTLLETAGARDERSQVFWLQTPRWHADLRIPAGRPDFSGVTCLAECDDAQLAWLATQQGFCGVTQVDGDDCTWHRQLDFQPANGRRDIGRMVFDGERVIETGVDADYREIWERLQHSLGGTAALELLVDAGELPARPAWLLVAGDCFIHVRGRAHPLPHIANQKNVSDLASLIARSRPSRAQLLDWLNVEISFGHRNGPAPWRIERSTLPFREGQFVTHPGALQRRGHRLIVEGNNERRWMIMDWNFGAML
ncbi:hypothetical protein [Thiobacillus sp.]|uniref:hypothetical protein n=1 Tax=Thiobacillus sp. TaxID=924 RepID=UPI00286D8303|nr:hypothetical protein [Thiobacillus sp.]